MIAEDQPPALGVGRSELHDRVAEPAGTHHGRVELARPDVGETHEGEAAAVLLHAVERREPSADLAAAASAGDEVHVLEDRERRVALSEAAEDLRQKGEGLLDETRLEGGRIDPEPGHAPRAT